MLVNSLDPHRPAIDALVPAPIVGSILEWTVHVVAALVDHGTTGGDRIKRGVLFVKEDGYASTLHPKLACALACDTTR